MTPAPVPRPRAPLIGFDDVPRHWFSDSAVATHIANGVNLLFPAGERFFVRSVKRYLDVVAADPALLEQVRGFFGQEGRHANLHERQFARLEAQGYSIAPFLKVYETLCYRVIERVTPPALRLAATAAAEHFTAIMAENALRAGLLADAHPAMRDLLAWHAAEEIEHRSVAFDVLQRVHPAYPLRVAGLAMAAAILMTFWTAGTLTLLRQDGLGVAGVRADARRLRARRQGRDHSILRHVFLRGVQEYLRPDFHPRDNTTDALASAYLAAAGLA